MKAYEKIGILLHQSHCSIVPENTALLFPNLLHFIFPKSLYFFFLFTFVSLEEFKVYPVFDLTLFGEIRKRVGHKEFDTLSEDLIRTVKGDKDQQHNKKKKKLGSDEPSNKDKLQADATVADQYIA